MFVDEPEKLCYNENSNSGIVENCPSLRRIFAVFETYREILQLIGKCLKKRRNFCIIKFGRGKPLSLLPLFAFESEVIYVKHY